MNTSLRAMTLQDLSQVVEIERENFSDPWSLQSFQEEVSSSRVSRPMVVTKGEEICGYIVPWFVADELQIADLAVKASYRRQGIGRMLLSHALELAQQQGCRVAYLEVRESNRAGRDFYERLGFEEEGIRRGYYGREQEDAILMRKILSIVESDQGQNNCSAE